MHQRHCEEFDSIYEGRIRNEIRKMLDAGELDRVRDHFGNKPRWLYFRNTRLSGPTADLAARLNDEREADRRRAPQGSAAALGWLRVGVW
jgi:hypothetical protein